MDTPGLEMGREISRNSSTSGAVIVLQRLTTRNGDVPSSSRVKVPSRRHPLLGHSISVNPGRPAIGVTPPEFAAARSQNGILG